MTVALVTLLGATGCLVRFLLEYAVRRRHPTIRPWATVTANALGCLIAGYATYRFTSVASGHMRSIITSGFCGGLTTFSSAFAIPALLAREHHWRYALAIVLTTPLACALCFALGMALAH